MWSRAELTYCCNVHPGATLSTVSANIEKRITAVASGRKLAQMSAGLWLANDTACELFDSAKKQQDFSHTLRSAHLGIGTLNGFPFGDFHQAVVKQKVYQPHWGEVARLQYTLTLARLYALAEVFPDQHATISTLPLGYAHEWSSRKQEEAGLHLISLIKALELLEKDTGKHVRICLEMEPDCVLERTDQLIDFFDYLIEMAKDVTPESIRRYLGCCYDTCHQAVMYEDVGASMQAIVDAGITIGKIQISNAITAHMHSRNTALELCNLLQEPKFLHQTKIKTKAGSIISLPDLNQDTFENAYQQFGDQIVDAEWRIHYHVPVHLESFDHPLLGTTQHAIHAALDFLKHSPHLHPTLEIETYTWAQFSQQKLSASVGDFNLTQELQRELEWLEAQLHQRELLKDSR